MPAVAFRGDGSFPAVTPLLVIPAKPVPGGRKAPGFARVFCDRCRDANCFEQLESSNLLGLEVTLVGSARILRWFMIDTELDSLTPFLSTEDSKYPAINLKNTISLRLVSFASVVYVVRLDYDRQLSDHLQFEQRVMLRFTFDIL